MLLALMVMPRSFSRSIESRTWEVISRMLSAPVSSSRRSARVDLPWSMCAMMQKLRMYWGSMVRFLASGTGCGDDAVSDVATDAEIRQTLLCARQPRVSNFRVCHIMAENRNWKRRIEEKQD